MHYSYLMRILILSCAEKRHPAPMRTNFRAHLVMFGPGKPWTRSVHVIVLFQSLLVLPLSVLNNLSRLLQNSSLEKRGEISCSKPQIFHQSVDWWDSGV